MMNSRRMLILSIRTAAFFVVAVIAAVMTGWSTIGIGAVALLGLATAVQLGGALWSRRQAGNTRRTS